MNQKFDNTIPCPACGKPILDWEFTCPYCGERREVTMRETIHTREKKDAEVIYDPMRDEE